MVDEALYGSLRAMIEALGEPVHGGDDPLELDSFSLLELIEQIERAHGVVIRADELVPERFETLNALARFIQQKKAAL